MNFKQQVLTAIGILFYSTIFSQLDYQIHEISSSALSVLEPQSVFAADLDGDGDMDALSASQGDDKIAWYENIDGFGAFGPLQLISDEIASARDVSAADLDGDGDMDVISAGSGVSSVAWFENLDGQGNFGEKQVIGTTNTYKVYPADMDEDGDMDIVSVTLGLAYWHENLNGQGNFSGPLQISSTNDDITMLYPADLDGDGDIDIAGASGINGTVFWYENIDASPLFEPAQQFSTINAFLLSLFVSDLDGDGDLDIISGASDSEILAWYENMDGEGTFSSAQTIGTSLSYIRDVFSADMDSDGDMDVLIASANPGGYLSWFENEDGLGDFGPEVVISYSQVQLRSLHIADINNDGALDVMAASELDQKISWYQNTGSGNFGSEQKILGDQVTDPRSARSIDLDGDGDKDIIVSSSQPRKIGWYENLDGQGTFGSHQVIAEATNLNSNINFSAADVDGDGDLDMVTANRDLDEVAWYENVDGSATFGPKNIITEGVWGFSSVSTADLDGDGDMDIIAAAWLDHQIAWFENSGFSTFGPIQLLPVSEYLPGFPLTVDVDNDGDMDIYTNISNDNLNVWYENTDGMGTFSSENYMTSEPADVGATILADLDADGDLDLLATAIFDDELLWYEHTDGLGTFGSEQVITAITTPGGIQFSDLDGDGDSDIILTTGNYNNGANNINWLENLDGLGTFGPIVEISDEVDGPHAVRADDIDGDGHLDLIAISIEENKIFWFENLAIDVGTNEIFINSQLSIYPNPAKSLVEIQFEEKDLESVSLYTLEGRKIKTYSSTIIDISGLSEGMYIVGVITVSGEKAFKKLIKTE